MVVCGSHGIVRHQIAARAPWQQGKTERHGSRFKELLEKAPAEAVVSDERELKMLMQEVEVAKNRFTSNTEANGSMAQTVWLPAH